MRNNHYLYGGHTDGIWMHIIVESPAAPSTGEVTTTLAGEQLRLPYLATFDHEPADSEIDVYRPAGFAHDTE